MKAKYKNPLPDRFDETFFSSLPTGPGVYFMRSASGIILYVGKATSLRNRLRSYKSARPGKVGRNIIKLLERVERIDWEEHLSEQRAFERERELIRALVPRYNIADAWEEDYFFVGLRALDRDRVHFRLTSEESDAEEFVLHGCYSQRRHVKLGYSALLRLLYAVANEKDKFSFPSKLTRGSPAYNHVLKLPQSALWRKRISGFLHGHPSDLVSQLVKGLLGNEKIPAYVRPGIQRDIETLRNFERACLELRRSQELGAKILSHKELRQNIRRSVDREDILES